MDSVNNIYLGKHKKFRMDSKKLATAFLVISFLVAIVVFWCLKLVGITVTGEAFCGIDEHLHSSECYVSEVVCGSDEISQSTLSLPEVTTEEVESDDETELDENITQESDDAQENTEVESATDTTEEITAQEIHTHTDACYEKILVCTETEHTHTAECFPDKTADVETVSDWLGTIDNVEITNDISENLVGIAMSQMGYEESFNNFEYDEDGNKNGYTRYGEWYGNPYGKWNVMFVSFCLHYSNVNNSAELKSAGAEAMRLAWQNRYAYASVSEHNAKRGDIVFIDSDKDKKADAVGIILYAGDESLQVIMGDSDNKVETKNIAVTDDIIGYGLTSELHFAKDMQYEETTESDVSVEEETKPELPDLMAAETPELIDDTDHRVYYETDLTRFVTDVNIRTQDNVEITNNSTVYIGQTYIITMEFKEDNEGYDWYQFGHNDEHYLTYDIPSNFHCEPFTEWHSITAKTENGTIEDVGKYFINEEGHLLVTFYDDENGVCFGHRYSNVDFVIEFNATVGNTQSDTSTNIVFSDEIKVNLNIDTTAEMKVTKTAKAYDGKNNRKEYTIRIEGTKAVIQDLIVYDDMYKNEQANNNHYALKDTIVVTDLEGNILDPQPTISDGRYTGNLGFTLTGFPDFAAGEGFIITYQAAINEESLDQDSVDLWNGVYPEGKDVTGKTVYAEAEYWEKVYLNKIEKDGKQTVIEGIDGNPVPVIEWEIEIRKSDFNLQGTVLVDTLGNGLKYYTQQPIKIVQYDQAGTKSDSSLSWDDVEIDGNSMTFALPDGYRFVIVYYTTYEDLQDGESRHYTNTAKVTINNKDEVAGGEADVVGFIPQVKKSASGNDGKYVYYEIEAEVPAVIKNWGSFFLTDLSAFWRSQNVGSLYVENSPVDISITAKTDSGREITFTPYVPGGPTENTYILVSPADGNQYHSFNIYFNTSVADKNLSTWILNEDSTLTITYKIPFDAATGTEWTGELTGDQTLEDVLLEKYNLSNEVYLSYTDVVTATASSSYKYTPTITKKSEVNEDGTIDYTVTFYNTIPGSVGPLGYLTLADSVLFTDTFDEKLEYVPGTLAVTCYSPWNDSLWFVRYNCNDDADEKISGNSISVEAVDFSVRTINMNADSSTIGWMEWIPNYQQYCNEVAGGRHVFTYTLKLKDKYLYSTEENKYELDNTAEVKWDTDGSSGPVTETVEYKTGLIDKHVVQKDDSLDFDIHINRNALDILPGSDTLTIEDTMTENLSVYWDSIKLLYEDQNGNWIDFDSAESQKEYTVTYDQHSNRLTFVVPDSLHIRIDYTTLVTQSGLVSVNNAVKIDAKAQVTDIIDAVFKVEQHSGGASGSMNSITLLKQDGDTDVALPDVTFLLYGPVGDPDAVKPADAQSTIVTDSNKTLRYIGSYTTGVDGTVKMASQYLTNGGPYALVEVAPPTGYNKLEKPVYFYYYNTDPNGVIQTVTTLIAVENYTYGYVLPETGGTGTLPLAIVGFALMAFPILYSTIRRKRERRLT